MKLFGGAENMAGAAGHREAPKARALAWGLGVFTQKNFEKSALSSHLSTFQSLNLKY